MTKIFKSGVGKPLREYCLQKNEWILIENQKNIQFKFSLPILPQGAVMYPARVMTEAQPEISSGAFIYKCTNLSLLPATEC